MARTSKAAAAPRYTPPALPAPEAGPVAVTRGMIPTSTCAQARVRLYQPTQRPTPRTGAWQVTPWGRCRVTGRLGQRHADIIEALLYHAEAVQQTTDGALYIVIDPARVRRTISGSGYSGGRLDALLREIMGAVVEIETERGRVLGHLIDEVVEAKARRRNPLAAHGAAAERALMRVRIGAVAAALISTDLHLHYDPAPIAALGSGTAQALARHVLTHSGEPRGGWRLDALLEAVGIEGTQAVRDARRSVRRDADGLAVLGIIIEADRVRRRGAAGTLPAVPAQEPGL